MCGITGYFNSEAFGDSNYLEKMTGRLSHRGPDNEGFYRNGKISLGHRRLSIIDLSENANQPMVSKDGRFVMVYNGEVYNFKEIAAQLTQPSNIDSDTAVILQYYVEKGESFVNDLNGMFAIAIYDNQLNSLSIWRDRIGIKPLYYFSDGTNFAFASELKALMSLPIDRKINKTALQDYLFLESIPEPNSIYENVFKLEKGHRLSVTTDKITKSCYYDLLHQLHPNSGITEAEYLDTFDELLHKSVKRRMISDVPIGAFLSGGTDSSAICAAYQELSKQSINTFTIGFKESEYDESEAAGKVAEILKTNHHSEILSEASSLELVNNTYEIFDEPFAVSSLLPMLRLSEVCRREVKVALSGDGGDELFMGYGYYNWQNRVEQIRNIGGKAGLKLASNLLSYGGNRSKKASRVLNYDDFQRIWLHIWSQEQYMFNEKEISRLTASDYRHQTLLKDWKKISDLDLDEHSKISLFDIRHYLSNNLLHKVDITSMAHGLEVRVPFLDHQMVEFAINLPENLKIRNGNQKYLLKKWLERKLPKEMVYRKKWGFPAPVNHWLKGELNYLFEAYLSEEKIKNSDVFDYLEVKSLVKKFNEGENFHYKRIWALIGFQMWWEQQRK